jgi:peptidyl-prolyl cis-trans isomerase B (cyclophilin B)
VRIKSDKLGSFQCFVQSPCLEKHPATVLFAFIRTYPIFQRPNEFFRFNAIVLDHNGGDFYNPLAISGHNLNSLSLKGAQPMSNPLVQMETSKGEIVLELDAEKAPISVANFLAYARAGHYDGTIFHRVIKSFMLQGGGFTPDMSQKPVNAPIKNEATNGLKNKAGTIAMARTSVVDSATSQFFINTVDNKFLDNAGLNPDKFGYAVFGKVIDGMNTVYAIEQAKTGNKGGHADVPVETITITKVTIVE